MTQLPANLSMQDGLIGANKGIYEIYQYTVIV